jgi:hypothetical protein
MGQGKWDMKIWTLAVFSFAFAFAGEKYGVYDPQGNRLSVFESERHELPEKARQAKSGYPNKAVYISSMQKVKGSKPSSQYRFKTGSYIEASRKETFAICPPDKKTEGTWISEYSVYLNAENCISVQTPGFAGTIDVLFMESSGKTDTIQVLVDQSYIQMGDYSHKTWVFDPKVLELSSNANPPFPSDIIMTYGKYESRNYNWNLIVDKTKFTAADAWRYSKIDSSVSPFDEYTMESKYKNVNMEESRLPLVISGGDEWWRLVNLRSKMEGLDTAYIMFYKHSYSEKDIKKFIMLEEVIIGDTNMYNGFFAIDSSASGYRAPNSEEWSFLMRAGASTHYYWGDEKDSLTVSRYAWVRPNELKPVAQLVPNQFGLYDMIGIAREGCRGDFFGYPECREITNERSYNGLRLMRKTPKLHKLEKF